MEGIPPGLQVSSLERTIRQTAGVHDLARPARLDDLRGLRRRHGPRRARRDQARHRRGARRGRPRAGGPPDQPRHRAARAPAPTAFRRPHPALARALTPGPAKRARSVVRCFRPLFPSVVLAFFLCSGPPQGGLGGFCGRRRGPRRPCRVRPSASAAAGRPRRARAGRWPRRGRRGSPARPRAPSRGRCRWRRPTGTSGSFPAKYTFRHARGPHRRVAVATPEDRRVHRDAAQVPPRGLQGKP